MNNTLISKKSTEVKANLLLVGLGEDPDISHLFLGETKPFRIISIDSAFRAYNWLDNLDEDRLPVAIICDYSFLEFDNFHFLTSVRSKAHLRNLPFIAVRNASQSIDRAICIKRGIDDCYVIPIEWAALEERIKFILKFKPQFAKPFEQKQELLEYRIPITKRILDIVIAGTALLLLSPLFILIALAIKLESKGPIIYKSKRVGTGYRVFNFLKFRSMYKDADKRLKDLQHLNQYNGNSGDNAFVKLNNDPRITRVGRLIRNTSIDELPQLINVLKGDMSVVGNRPLPLYEAELLTKDDWARRFLAPAGITGLWQVTKRGGDDMSTQERMDLDITYAKNFSVWYDIKIIMKTLPAMIQKENV